MNISMKSKEDIRYHFINLGYNKIQYSYNYNKSYLGMQSVKEIKNIHLITNTKQFKIWLYELEIYNFTIINKIAKRFYDQYPEECNLLIFTNLSYTKLTFLNYIQGVNEKLKIRKLNIENNSFTTTDKEIIGKLDISKKNIYDDLDIKDIHNEAFNIEKVTDEFFNTFKKQIDYLVKNIKGIERKEDRKNYSVLLLSRMLFLYFIQKKKWLNGKIDYLYDRFLYCIEQGDINYYENILEPLFFNCLNKSPEDEIEEDDKIKVKRLYEDFKSQTPIEVDENFIGIPYLNGGLFERNPKYEINNDIHIENDVFESLFENLFQKYNFTVREDIGFDSDVAVDPELLGRIFENMINKEEREGTGSFYTPRPIISYMCKQSIKEYLLDSTTEIDKEKIENLVDNIEDEKSVITLDESEINIVINLLNKVKICDTAVGSGAFILGMLQLLVSLKRELYKHIENDLYKDSYEMKKYIIKNNLSGVDIQEGAIDIAHLRVWLSLVVDYEAKTSKDIKSLPNLKYRLIHGNSLISTAGDINIDEEVKDINEECTKQLSVKSINRDKDKVIGDINKLVIKRDKYFDAVFKDKQNLEINIDKLEDSIKEYFLFDSDSCKDKNLCFSWQLAFPEVFNNDNKLDRGFDIIIGNPPYVSNKKVNKLDYKNQLQQEFGFIDDLYNHFTCKQFSLLKENGILSYITSNTFFTIKSKLNMRKLLQSKYIKEIIVTPKAFNALVDTSIFIVKNIDKEKYKLKFIDTSKCSIDEYYNLEQACNKEIYEIDINLYRDNLDNVFFIPDKINMQIYEKIIPKTKELYDIWKDKICGSDKIKKNEKMISKYINENIKQGSITLLGLITDGGVGLQTGNNGKFLGVREGTKSAESTKIERVEKFYKNIIKNKNNKIIFEREYPNYLGINSKKDVKDFLNSLSEYEIRNIFDNLKELIERDVFGQGYIFKIINEIEIKNVEDMTEYEKLNGIDDDEKVYVSYDKGDKEGNRWYLETPFYINWSTQSVDELRTSKKARWQGYDFYFREGFCWSDINTIYLKSRIKDKSIHDVKSMSLFSKLDEAIISEKYFVAMINSKFISEFTSNFYNNTSTFQINDGRRIPIIIPTREQLKYINNLVDQAIEIKKLQFNKSITKEKAEVELQKIQAKIDEFVYKLYDIKLED